MNSKWILTPRQRCDLEMLLNGGFAPVTAFLSEANYHSVLSHMRLTNGQLWPMPITLDVDEEFANKLCLNQKIELHDADNCLLAYLNLTDKWQPNKLMEAQILFGTQDIKHPGVNYLLNKAGSWYLGGTLELVQLPEHYDFVALRHTPATLKLFMSELGWTRIVGFQTRNPMHRAHMELTLRAAQQIQGQVLIHPVVGLTKIGDIDYYTRVRCYEKMLKYYPPYTAALSLLPLAMRMGGPREALWHAIIRKNYGCTHFIVGRDHAGPGNDTAGKPFYAPYAAQELVNQYQDELGIQIIPFQEMVYVKERQQYSQISQVKADETALTVSGTELRLALLKEQAIPDWFSFPEIIQELRNAYPPQHKRGLTIFFTGLSGSGKTTLSNALLARLMSYGRRNISLLDGDIVRQVLTTELGFSKAHRDLNIRRIGFVAAEITKANGLVICAAIAPYTNARNENRQLISQFGAYIEVYLSTSLTVCEKRDKKGLYLKARNGEIKGFTGIDDPYEAPANPEIEIDTASLSIDAAVNIIIHYLEDTGYLKEHCSHEIDEPLQQSLGLAH